MRYRLAQLFCLPLLASAAVTQIKLVERTDVLEGQAQGKAGPYERIMATAYFAVDPQNPANQKIADLAHAPRNEQGLVEFSADLYVLKPRNPAQGNGTALFEVSNRGGKGMLSTFNRAKGSPDPRVEAEFGDHFLLTEGYTLVWLGWQFDVPEKPGLLRLQAPIAKLDGKPITGRVRADFVPDQPTRTFPVSDRGHQPYAAIDLQESDAILTERDTATGPRRTIPRNEWQFAHEERGRCVPDGTAVYRRAGFVPGKIYEVIYTAQNPPVAGLGLAAVRDLMSYFKYGGAETLLADQHRFTKRTIGFGISQSGRFLRSFLYFGANADEQNRPVFDGTWAHVAGAGRGSFNQRFAQPSRDGQPFANFLYPTDTFPFTDAPLDNPDGGVSEGLLPPGSAVARPKIFYTNGAYEYWGRTAALIHVSANGKRDVPPEPLTRIYSFAGTQHTNGSFPPVKQGTAYTGNPHDYRFTMRALLIAMQNWVSSGQEPPASRYPRLERDELVTTKALHFPALPGVRVPPRPHLAYRVSYGPAFRMEGVMTEPPQVAGEFPCLVPQVDADGNELAGIRSLIVRVPIATYTGWNLRDPRQGAADEMPSFTGSYFPFARTKAERLKTGDPRLSLEERYRSRRDYLDLLHAAAKELVSEGFLLERDAPDAIERAAHMYDSW